MPLIEHKISLDIKSPRSVEPITLMSDNLGAYSIVVTITSDGKEVDLSGYTSPQLKVECLSAPISGTISDNKAVFSLTDSGIQEGWSVCSVKITPTNSAAVDTQSFEIYYNVHHSIQVADASFVELTASQKETLAQLAANIDTNDVTNINALTPGGIAVSNTLSADGASPTALAGLKQDDVTLLQRFEGGDPDKLHNSGLINKVTYAGDSINYSSTTNLGSKYMWWESNGHLTINPLVADVQCNGKSVVADSNKAANIKLNMLTNTLLLKKVNWDNTKSLNVKSQICANWGLTVDSSGTLISYIFTGLDKVKFNGKFSDWIIDNDTTNDSSSNQSLLTAQEINAFDKFSVGETTVTATPEYHAITFKPGTGVSITPSATDASLTFAFDATSGNVIWPYTQISVPENSSNGYVLMIVDGKPAWVGSGETGNINVTISQNFSFADFATADTMNSDDQLPFIRTLDGVETKYKTTWSNMMTKFAEIHKTILLGKSGKTYFSVISSVWGSSTSTTVNFTSAELLAYNLTAVEVLDEATRLHIYPTGGSTYLYANSGIICSSVESDGSNGININFTRNNSDNWGSAADPSNYTLNIIAEVCIG